MSGRSGKLRTRKLRNLLMQISTEFSELKYEAEYRHNSVLAIFNLAARAMLKCSYKFVWRHRVRASRESNFRFIKYGLAIYTYRVGPYPLLSLSLFRLSTAYLPLALALLFSNFKFEKKFELKIWRVKFINHLLTFSLFLWTLESFQIYCMEEIA